MKDNINFKTKNEPTLADLIVSSSAIDESITFVVRIKDFYGEEISIQDPEIVVDINLGVVYLDVDW